jgi:energy-coupling factor transport system substrate-specific component
MASDDYYKILQVDSSAEPDVIDAAYRRLMRKYHPDINDSPDATEKTKKLVEAFSVLSNPQKRREYDSGRVDKASKNTNVEPNQVHTKPSKEQRWQSDNFEDERQQREAEQMAEELKREAEDKAKEEMFKKEVWKFGTRQVVFAAIGAALYAVLSIATNFLNLPGTGNVSFRPAVAIPMFFGVAFGPIVGFISGFIGNILSDLYGFWFWWDLGVGIMGLIPGLIWLTITNYRVFKSILKAELLVIIGVIVGMGLAAISEIWISGADINTVIFIDFLPAAISNLINGLVLIPILMIAFSSRRNKSVK